MIFVLTKNMEYNNCYYIEKFETKDEALKFIRQSNYFIGDYRFIEGSELKLSFEIVECNEGECNANTN